MGSTLGVVVRSVIGGEAALAVLKSEFLAEITKGENKPDRHKRT